MTNSASVKTYTVPSPETGAADQVWTGHLLGQAALQLRSATAAALVPLGLTPPMIRVLEAIANRPNQTQVRLGQAVTMDRTTMVHIIDRLEALDAARRMADPDDRRSHVITLTDSGRTRLDQAQQLARDVEDAVLAPLTAGERDQLNRLLLKIHHPRSCSEEIK